MDTTFDALLNKRVWLEQPAEGYRIAVDTVLLAAAVPAQSGQKVLDMGCGVGGAMFCLAARVPELHLIGIDVQSELIALCQKNIEHNRLVGSVEALVGDVTNFSPPLAGGIRGGGHPLLPPSGLLNAPPPNLPRKGGGTPAVAADGLFDHVLMNPPFHEEARHSVSDNKIKRTANAEKTGDLPLWIESAARALNSSGVLTLIHRADRLDDLIKETGKHFGKIDILPIISRPDAVSKRVILRAHKGSQPQVNTCESFVLYGDNGRYNDAAEAVIRHCQPLPFTSM